MGLWRLLMLAVVLLLPGAARARTVEPGTIWATAALGPGFRLGSALGAADGNLLVMAQGEYAISSALSAVAELNLGIARTLPLRFRPGARYRLTGLALPLSPYAQAQLSVGELFDVLGANLTYIGARLGAGADYFLTGDLSAGASLGVDLGSTVGERSAFYGSFEVMIYASMALGKPSELPPPPPPSEEVPGQQL